MTSARRDTDVMGGGARCGRASDCGARLVTRSVSVIPLTHIFEIVAKAHQRANIILRCFMSNDKRLLLRAFFVYVRPIPEYCSVVWSPCTKKDTDYIEKVQRQFTKRLPGLKSMSYTDRPKFLGLTRLELRRLHLDLIFCYKIVFGMVAINFSDIFEFSHVSKTRGHAYKLFKSHSNNSTRCQFFC